MSTVREIAEKLGVTTQAVYKEINKQGFKPSLKKVHNQFTLSDEQETLILQAFQERGTQLNCKPVLNQFKESFKPVDNQFNAENERLELKNQVSELKTELERIRAEKDLLQKTVDTLNADKEKYLQTIDKLTAVADQAQKLQAIAEQRAQALEDKQQEHRGFFRRLFNRG